MDKAELFSQFRLVKRFLDSKTPYAQTIATKVFSFIKTLASKRDGWRYLLDGVEPLPWDIHFDEVSTENINYYMLKPMLKSDVDKFDFYDVLKSRHDKNQRFLEIRRNSDIALGRETEPFEKKEYVAERPVLTGWDDYMVKRITDATQVNHFIRPMYTLFTLFFSCDSVEQFNSCIGTRALKHYLNDPRIGMDPYFDGSRGSVVLVSSQDTITAKRIKVCFEAVIWEVNNMFKRDLLEEFVPYTLYSPDERGAAFKKVSSVCRDMMLANSGKAQGIRYANNTGYMPIRTSLEEVETATTRGIFKFYEKSFNESIEVMSAPLAYKEGKLVGHGLPRMAAEYKRLATTAVNKEAIDDMHRMHAPAAISGYTHTEVNQSIQMQYKDPPARPIPSMLPFAESLRNEFAVISDFMYKNDLVLSFRGILEIAHNLLTSKAAGMGGRRIQISIDGKPYKVSFSDKTMIYFHDGADVFDAKRMELALTELLPGNFGSRAVPEAKNTRAICAVPLNIYFGEANIARGIEAYMNLPKNKGDFPTTWMTGRMLFDHMESLNSTMDAFKLLFDGDFSRFDATVGSQFRENASLGLLDGESLNPKGEWGGTGFTYMEYVCKIWSKYANAHFQMKNDDTIAINAIASGERSTLALNSVFNRSFWNGFFLELATTYPDLVRFVSVDFMRFVGDDMIALLRFTRQPTADDVKKIIELAVDYAKRSGMELNPIKTLCLPHTSVFLQVKASYGYLLKRFHTMQLISKEKPPNLLRPMENIIALKTQCEEMMMRGLKHEFATNLVYSTWLFASELKGDGGARWRYPMYALGLPLSLGGAGMNIFNGGSVIGTNCDSLIYIEAKKRPKLYQALNELASLLMTVPVDPKADAAKKVLKTGGFVKGMRDARRGLNSDKIMNSRAAIERLKSKGINLRSNVYENSLNITAAVAMTNSPNFMEIEADYIHEMVMHLSSYRNVSQSVMKNQFEWLDLLTFEKGEPLEDHVDLKAQPFPNLDSHVDELIMKSGLSGMGSMYVQSFSDNIQPLVRDGFNFRAFSTSFILRLLSRRAVWSDPVAIQDVLVAMGASVKAAGQVAGMNRKSLDTLRFLNDGTGFSLNGAIFRELDFTQGNFSRYVDIQYESRPSQFILTLLNHVAFHYALCMFGGTHKCVVKMDGAWHERMTFNFKYGMDLNMPILQSIFPSEATIFRLSDIGDT